MGCGVAQACCVGSAGQELATSELALKKQQEGGREAALSQDPDSKSPGDR